MNLLQLKVVLWKNLIIRKRHWLLTTIESVLPALLFLIIAYTRSKIPDFQKTSVLDPTTFFEHDINYDHIDIGLTQILYTPESDTFYKDVIYKTSVKFQIPNDRIRGFNSEESLMKYYYKNHNDTVIAVVFKSSDHKKFDYVIRYHDSNFHEFLGTSRLYSNRYFDVNYDSDYFYAGFLSIQKALDLSFIEQSLGKQFDERDNVSITLKKFPYPPHTEDNGLEDLLRQFLPSFTLLSFIFICPAILQRVVEEKHSGIKELMKMVGMKPWMLWLGWFINGMIPMVFAISYIVFLLKVPLFGTEFPAIEYTHWSIIFCFLLLYCMAANVFCFMISTSFNKPAIAMVTGLLIWILSYFVPKYSFGIDEPVNELTWIENILIMILPNMALHYGFAAISSYEKRELGVQWDNFAKAGSGGSEDVTMFNVFAILIVDIILYWTLTNYCDALFPGKYGVGKSFLYPLKYLREKFTSRNTVEDDAESVHLETIEDGSDFKKGIEIRALSKRYGQKMAVDHLSLDIYRNQITVLLGHNGAGKSTTMSIITGMLKATSGSIVINDMNIKDNMEDIRKSLGLCPQHNLLFTDLTVKEHLIFFAKLKGSRDVEGEAVGLLKKLNIYEKQNELAHTLSGGMKRKLCLGMALIGGSKVLILDEPSSGMDPESRRELWDLLLSWRGEKTILITTHFMEEADVLGDWIAIMADGKLSCYGTSMYLKKSYDAGYHLSLMFKEDSEKDKEACRNLILKHIPKCQEKSSVAKNLVFVLPFENSSDMESLLSLLETNTEQLKIENISITITTLEDVFLKSRMNSDKEDDTKYNDTEALLDSNVPGIDVNEEPLKMRKLRIETLFVKRLNFFKSKFFTYIIPTIISLFFFATTVFLSSNSNDYYKNMGPELKLRLDSYKKTSVYFNGTQDSSEFLTKYKHIAEEDGSLAFRVNSVDDAIVTKAMENILYYKEHMVTGVEFSYVDRYIKAIGLYNVMALHSAPISLNLITNTIAKVLLGDEYSISTSNWPLESINAHLSPAEYAKHKVVILWVVMVPLGCLFILASFILFPHTEISSKFMQIQYMCGVTPPYYWIVNFVADMLIYLITIIPLTLFICLVSTPFRGLYEFGTLTLLFFMYGMCCIPNAYLFSRKKTASGAFSTFIILGLFLGVILALVLIVLINSGMEYYIKLGENLKIVIFLFIPHVNLVYSLFQYSDKTIDNYNMFISPKKLQSVCSFNPNPCCYGSDTEECSAYKAYVPILSQNLGLMFCSFLIYMAFNILLDTYWLRKGVFQMLSKVSRYYYSFKNKSNTPDKQKNKKSDVPNDQKYNTLRASKLQKTYSGKSVVNNIDITLNHGDCLGILGVNGAGKTTTFRMLTREEIVDEGQVEINLGKKKIDINENEYLEKLGYCPQSDALNYVLTGRQILQVVANLRGVNDPNIVEKFLKCFGLEKYADMPSGHYSGGNKRKLSLAVSLIGYRNFVLLDEPTNGVDPTSRRKCWGIIKKVQKDKNISFILTSHSMVECEALCNDLKIMKNGEFHKEGTISKLKKDCGGFSVKLKLKKDKNKIDTLVNLESETSKGGFDVVDSISCSSSPTKSTECVALPTEDELKFNGIEDLKYHFEQKGELKDEHSGLLHFYIKDCNKRWSAIFHEIETIKRQNPDLIEDYAISEASLEDVFLEVARS